MKNSNNIEIEKKIQNMINYWAQGIVKPSQKEFSLMAWTITCSNRAYISWQIQPKKQKENNTTMNQFLITRGAKSPHEFQNQWMVQFKNMEAEWSTVRVRKGAQAQQWLQITIAFVKPLHNKDGHPSYIAIEIKPYSKYILILDSQHQFNHHHTLITFHILP